MNIEEIREYCISKPAVTEGLPFNDTVLVFKSVSVVSMVSGCTNAREPVDTGSELSEPVAQMPDTLIYSSPVNYLLILEKVDSSSEVEIRSYKDMFELFEKLGYTPEAWQSGIREVPRVYLPIIGERWGPTSSKEITIENKKRLFFRGLAPLILRSNELIMMDRNRLETIRGSYTQQMSMAEEDQEWILKLAALYKVKPVEGDD